MTEPTEREAIFGWGAPPFKEQFPNMRDEAAQRFDEDNKAMIRLRLRGYLTDSQRDAVMRKITSEVQKEVRRT